MQLLMSMQAEPSAMKGPASTAHNEAMICGWAMLCVHLAFSRTVTSEESYWLQVCGYVMALEISSRWLECSIVKFPEEQKLRFLDGQFDTTCSPPSMSKILN